MTTIAVIGAGGRMGHALVRCIERSTQLKLAVAVDQNGHPAIGEDAGAVAGGDPIGVKISEDLRTLGLADVIIDFTLPSATIANVQAALEAGKPLVIGTTGLGDQEMAVIRDAARTLPIVCTPNMSLGVNLLFALVKNSAAVLGMDYRVELDETHHVHKKDAPSGTALRLGEKVAEGRGQDFRNVMIHEPGRTHEDDICEDEPEPHPADKIVIHSHRSGEVVGDHTVSFANEGETLELTHHAWSREAFAMGALRAAQWVVGRQPGLYDMQNVLGL